jgi:hypothetical protein
VHLPLLPQFSADRLLAQHLVKTIQRKITMKVYQLLNYILLAVFLGKYFYYVVAYVKVGNRSNLSNTLSTKIGDD